MTPITEAEAAKLVCPFTRSGAPLRRVDDGTPDIAPPEHGCMGRACMLWKWDRQYCYASEDEVKAMPLLEVDRPLNISNLRQAARAAKTSSPLASCYIVKVSEKEVANLINGLLPNFVYAGEYGSLRRIPGDAGACEMIRFQCDPWTAEPGPVSTGTCGAAR